MPTDWKAHPEWIDHWPDPRISRAERAAWAGVDSVARPPWGVQLWIMLACALSTVGTVLGAWAVAQFDFPAAGVFLAVTLVSSGVMLLGIDYARVLTRDGQGVVDEQPRRV